MAASPEVEGVGLELDPTVLQVAQTYFGLPPPAAQGRLRVEVGEGLSFTAAQLPSSFQVVLIDVDGKDASEGLSAPPPSFLTPEALSTWARVLAPHGALLLDLVTRSDLSRTQALTALTKVFASVVPLPVSVESSNRLVLATLQPLPPLTKTEGLRRAEEAGRKWPLPAPLTWRGLVEDLDYDWAPEPKRGKR